MPHTRTRACLVAGLSFALLAGATALAQSESKPADPAKQSEPGKQAEPGGGGAGGAGGGAGRGRGRGGAGDAMPTSGEQAMRGMNRALRALQPNIADASKQEENLKAIGDMERNCIIAKSMPLRADVKKEVTEANGRARLSNAYRTELIKLARALLDLEQSVMDGKGEQAKTQLDAILKLRDASHEALGIKDE